ncbi:MAG: hypothetical protein KC475_05375 [Cyanobacteria bacterium HKST-UBA03]|nr:hypothetical protein [Cyanobacteria bacterium HKST-UBA03]
MTNPVALPLLVRATEKFQEYGLVNKGVLEVVGVDVPMIGLARNPAERKEVLFRQTVILVAAFMLAPLHAYFFRNHYARRARIPKELMRFSYEHLLSGKAFAHGLGDFLKTVTPKTRRAIRRLAQTTVVSPHGSLHKRILDAKTNMMTVDLMLEGLIFANLGFIKNAFGRLITGKKQFTGEMGVVSQNTLDAMYARRHNQAGQQNPIAQKCLSLFQRWGPTAMAVAGTPLLAQAMKRAVYKQASPNPVLNRMYRFLRSHARHFDYKEGLMLGLGPILFIGILNDVGDVMAARSPHERREVFLKRLPVTVTFFFGDLIWMGLMAKAFSKRLGVPVTRWITHAIAKAPAGKKVKAGKWASLFYAASFLLNVATVSAVIVANNRLTTRKVRQEAKALKAPPMPMPMPLSPPPVLVPSRPPGVATQWSGYPLVRSLVPVYWGVPMNVNMNGENAPASSKT